MTVGRAAAVHTRSSLWRSWLVWVTAGELVGFTFPAVVGVLSTGWPDLAEAAALVGAGAVEGAALGWAQTRVLRRVLPQLGAGAFILATSAAAMLAYAISMVPVIFGARLLQLPMPVLVALATGLGALLLASIGTAQWLVLRRSLARSASWVATTAAAWAAGLLAFTAVAPPLWQPGQPVLLAVAIGLLGGLVMATVVAAITGWAVLRLMARHVDTA